MAEQRGSVSLKSFTKWPFKDDFETRVEQGQVAWAKCKFCSVILQETYINEAKRRGLKGKALSSNVSYSDGITYIHRTNFAKHVGDAKSLHLWAKSRVGGAIESDKSEPSSSAAVQAIDQPRVDVLLINKSNELYRVLFTTVLTIVEEELSLRKL